MQEPIKLELGQHAVEQCRPEGKPEDSKKQYLVALQCIGTDRLHWYVVRFSGGLPETQDGTYLDFERIIMLVELQDQLPEDVEP